MKPTNKQLNILCARCMGHEVTYATYLERTSRWIRHDEVKDYCSDRNVLQEVYKFLNDSRRSTWEAFGKFEELIEAHESNTGILGTLMTPPRLQVIAFIKATGNWNDQWDEEE